MFGDRIEVVFEVTHDDLELEEVTAELLFTRLVVHVLEGLLSLVVCLGLICLRYESFNESVAKPFPFALLFLAFRGCCPEGICTLLCIVDASTDGKDLESRFLDIDQIRVIGIGTLLERLK